MTRDMLESADDVAFDSLLRRVAAAPSLEPDDCLPPGTVIGDSFRLLDRVGAGGMGVVYCARDERLEREVALKLPSARRGTEDYRRLLREARAMARLNHRNVVTVHEVGEWNDRLFIAMEYVGGGTLQRWLQSTQRPLRDIVEAFVEAGRGLAAAHAAGLVHRDFKPTNVLLGVDGRVLVSDFGLAIADDDTTHSQSGPRPMLPASPLDSKERLTRTGTLLGTVGYIAPEVYAGQLADAGSDQFSFCVSLWEAVTGTRPFQGSEEEIRNAVLAGAPVTTPRDDQTLPRWLRAVLIRGLSPSPQERWSSMEALIDALVLGLGRRKRRMLWAGGLLAASLVLTLGGQVWPTSRAVCDGALPRVQDLWSEARKERVHTRIATADAPIAPHAADRFANTMDGFVAAWSVEHTRACEATRVFAHQSEHLLDLRMACLDGQWHRADGLITLIENTEVSPAVLLETERWLEEPRKCADLELLESTVKGLSSEQLTRHRQLVLELERIPHRSRLLFGDDDRIDRSLAELESLAEQAVDANLQALAARVHYHRGSLYRDLQRNVEAAIDLRRCAQLATASGDGQLFAFCTMSLVNLFPSSGMTRERAEATFELAEAALSRLPGEYERAVMNARLALPAAKLGQIDRGLTMARHAHAFLETNPETDPLELSEAKTNYALILLLTHRPEPARQLLLDSLAIQVDLFGDESLMVAEQRVRLAQLELRMARHEHALQQAREALRVFEHLGHARRAEGLEVHYLIGMIYERLGRLDEALASIRAGLELHHAESEDLTPDSGEILGNLALLVFRRGGIQEALELSQRSRAALEHTYGHLSYRVVEADTLHGGMARRVGRVDEARDVLNRAHTLCSRILPPEAGQCVNAAVELATAENAAGAFDRALELVESVLQHARDSGNPEYAAEAELALAQALAGLGADLEGARAAALQARARYAALAPNYSDELEAVDDWIARLDTRLASQ